MNCTVIPVLKVGLKRSKTLSDTKERVALLKDDEVKIFVLRFR